MKKSLLLLALGSALACPALAQQLASTPPPPPAKTTPPTGGMRPSILTDDERKELSKARADALKANPDLVTEGKDLDGKKKALQKKIDQAAIAVDPNVAPILAKIEAAHPTPPPKPPKPTPTPKPPKPAPTPKPKPSSTPSTNAPSATPSATN